MQQVQTAIATTSPFTKLKPEHTLENKPHEQFFLQLRVIKFLPEKENA